MDKQQEILAAALKLFVEFGFHGTPTSKIAQEAGVANGTLFHYFKTKDELVVALYIDIKTKMGFCMENAVVPGESLKSTFRSIFTTTLYWALNNKLEFSFIQQFTNSPFMSLVPAEKVSSQVQDLFRLIQGGIDAEVLKPVNVQLIYILIMSNVFGIFQYLTAATLDSETQKETISATFDMCWDMIT